MGVKEISMKAMKFIGIRTREEGAEEVLDLCSNAIRQNGVILIWRENPSLISTCSVAVHEQT
jgi:hypothetical protein